MVSLSLIYYHQQYRRSKKVTFLYSSSSYATRSIRRLRRQLSQVITTINGEKSPPITEAYLLLRHAGIVTFSAAGAAISSSSAAAPFSVCVCGRKQDPINYCVSPSYLRPKCLSDICIYIGLLRGAHPPYDVVHMYSLFYG